MYINIFLLGLGVKEIIFTNSPDGKPSGECYVELITQSDVDQALQRDHNSIGSRYIEGKKTLVLYLYRNRVEMIEVRTCFKFYPGKITLHFVKIDRFMRFL